MAVTPTIRAAVLAVLVSAPAYAASEAELDALYAAIGTPRLLEIMRIEGMEQAGEMASDMFGDGAGSFTPMASRIYDTARMAETFRVEFDAVLADADVGPLLDFFGSDRGRQIVELELSAREALLNPDVEDAAERAAEALIDDDPDRRALIEGFVDANDLIELNVMGAMNASVAYYQGLADAGDVTLPERELLAEVWAQEPDIRADTSTWVFAYLGMAYEPLSDDDLKAYTALAGSPHGRALNRALFEGFDDVFNEISYLLGGATVRFGQSEEL
ncbi:DUF2059 domain-containing protein [Alphaproteobacteria bacterium GH1-50]|uniref:DUF2059 domain-containing protein n=1 Tax=Kangsaoukella pontilimi TaxID=2691042 RepID=A0A7C9IFU6_9RHOB|nr:DUF2059 domain-containing protein [Kangsaoukella pontilimi]MXQ07824.1 DUF2059 domain-containing protein [Kangsaoukella pontilimi]